MKHTSVTKGKGILVLAVMLLVLVLSFKTAEAETRFNQTNLVSNIPGLARFTDPDLVNPWGISQSPTSPFWISDNGTGVSTLYRGTGVKQGLVVSIPGAGNPTGQVFNPTAAAGTFNGDLFIFASEDGTISGWRGALGTNAEVLKLADPANVYKGLALAAIGTNTYLYAANFLAGKIDVLPSAGAPALPGTFTDPGIPSGYAPFNIRNINGVFYVTYAVQNGIDDLPGPGNGIVSVFDTDGNFIRRLISNGGVLNSPWGLALAPSNFGEFSNDLLVGNFGDGHINAFNPANGAFIGALLDSNGLPIVIDGLWGLTFGNGGNGGDLDKLYFTAGLNGEADGLFGRLAPLPGSLLLLGSGLLSILVLQRSRQRK